MTVPVPPTDPALVCASCSLPFCMPELFAERCGACHEWCCEDCLFLCSDCGDPREFCAVCVEHHEILGPFLPPPAPRPDPPRGVQIGLFAGVGA